MKQRYPASHVIEYATFLNPVASVSMAFYSIWQNIFNSYQIYRQSRS